MLHVLLHMARQEAPFTSVQLARMLAINPVVVWRAMAGLKQAGYVHSERGHGGGWKLACDLAQVSLLASAISNTADNLECGVEKVVNGSGRCAGAGAAGQAAGRGEAR